MIPISNQVRCFPIKEDQGRISFFILNEWIPQEKLFRFWREQEVKASGCIYSTLRKGNSFGHRRLSYTPEPYKKKHIGAHRLAYELLNGPVGDKGVLHRCDRPMCVNPEHLFLGTQADNVKDRSAKGRTYNGKVRDLWYLTDQMQELRDQGLTYKAIGHRLGVNDKTVRNYLVYYPNERKE